MRDDNMSISYHCPFCGNDILPSDNDPVVDWDDNEYGHVSERAVCGNSNCKGSKGLWINSYFSVHRVSYEDHNGRLIEE